MSSGVPGSASTGTDLNLGSQNFNTSGGAFNAGPVPPTGAAVNVDASQYSGNVFKASNTANSSGTLSIDSSTNTLSWSGNLSVAGTISEYNVVTSLVTKTSDYAVSATDYAIDVDTSGGAVTITLPASPTNGRLVVITKITSDANTLTIARNGKKLQNATSNIATTSGVYPSYTLQYNSTALGWFLK
jgi:hypothetical protein